MSEDRKLSDIILGIEADVKLLLKLYGNIDANFKIMLNNLNNLKKQSIAPITPSKAPERRINYPPTPPFPTPAQKIIPPKIDEEGMALIAQLSKEKAQKGALGRRDMASPSANKTQIIQTINYPDGRKLFLANIKIFKDGELINQTRTSPKGKWTAPLMPGEYFIHVSKVDSDSKKLVELKYNIDVPEAAEPVELEAAIVRS